MNIEQDLQKISMNPSEQWKSDTRTEIVQYAATHQPENTPWFIRPVRTAVVLACALILIATSTATISYAGGVQPDSPLYPIKRMVESARLKLARSEMMKSELKQQFLRERERELEYVRMHKPDLVDRVQKDRDALSEPKHTPTPEPTREPTHRPIRRDIIRGIDTTPTPTSTPTPTPTIQPSHDVSPQDHREPTKKPEPSQSTNIDHTDRPLRPRQIRD